MLNQFIFYIIGLPTNKVKFVVETLNIISAFVMQLSVYDSY